MAWWRRWRDENAGPLTTDGRGRWDLTPTLASLTLTLAALATLGVLIWAPHAVVGGWSWYWLAAAVGATVGVLIGAPVLTGKVVVALTAAGLLLAGAGLVAVGSDQISDERVGDARAAATLLAFRLDDLGPATGVPPDLMAAARAAVTESCEAAAGRQAAPPGRSCEPDEQKAPGSLQGIASTRGRAELAVGRAELAAATDDESRAAARAAVEEARRAAARPSVERVEVVTALATGAGHVIADLLKVDEPQVPLVFAAFGWVAVAVVVLALVRWVAVRNATRGLGPVALEAPATDEPSWRRYEETFRTHLLENVPEPGTVPNAEALVRSAELVGALAPHGEPTRQVVDRFVRALSVPRGYAVQVGLLRDLDATPREGGSVAGDGDAAACPVEGVVVRVRKAYGRALLGQKEFRWPGPEVPVERTVREAAYWAAAVIVAESRSVPAWSRWSRDTAAALADCFEAEEGERAGLLHLRQAEKAAPSSGVILHRLAHAEEQEGDFAAALVHALDAVTLYPRYLDARYRVASEAGMLAVVIGRGAEIAVDGLCLSLDRYLARAPAATRRAARALRAALAPAGAVDLARLQAALLELALAERGEARRRMRLPRVALNALRSSERDYWWAMGARRARRDRLARLDSADLAARYLLGQIGGRAESSRAERRTRRLWAQARERSVLWQVPYNLACWCSLSGQYGEAIEMLERARLARANHQLTADWVEHDPDLAPLSRARPQWFGGFVANLRGAERPPAQGSTGEPGSSSVPSWRRRWDADRPAGRAGAQVGVESVSASATG